MPLLLEFNLPIHFFDKIMLRCIKVLRLVVFVKELHVSEDGADCLLKDPTGEIEARFEPEVDVPVS